MAVELDKLTIRETIARRVAQELHDGELVNLGIGLPTFVPDYLPADVQVVLQAENGIVGAGPATETFSGRYVVNAGGQPASAILGGAFIDSATSFALIRGGHVDVTVLGALEVDQDGNLANWIIPGKIVPGMGGAMDLVVGAKRVIVAMEHTQKGRPKILRRCSLPLTAVSCVDMIVTEMAVMEFIGGSLVLTEVNPLFTVQDVLDATDADLVIPAGLTHPVAS